MKPAITPCLGDSWGAVKKKRVEEEKLLIEITWLFCKLLSDYKLSSVK